MAGAGSLAELQYFTSASLFKTFPVGWWVGLWVGGGWLRKTGDKAQLRPAGAAALPKLGNRGVFLTPSLKNRN